MSDAGLQTVRDLYRAFATADRELAERLLHADLVFFAPPDPGIDRAGYFERCWPGAGHINVFDFERLTAIADDEVLVTYEATREDGTRFRNTEVLTLADDGRVRQVEVYFGWDLPAS